MSYTDTLISQYKSEAIKPRFTSYDEVVKAWRANPDAMSFIFTLRMNAFYTKSNELGL